MTTILGRLATAAALAGVMAAGSAAAAPERSIECQPDGATNGYTLGRRIEQANGNGVPDVIELVDGCLYTLDRTLTIAPDPAEDTGAPNALTIRGNGAVIERPRERAQDPAGNSSIPSFRVVDVAADAILILDDATITGGRAPAGDGGGGAIRVSSFAQLVLDTVTLAGNSSPDVGAALSIFGRADVRDTVFTDNRAGEVGSAIENALILDLVGATLSDNTGTGGATIRNTGRLTMANATLTRNTGWDAVVENTFELVVGASTIAGNDGTGIRNRVFAVVRSSIVTGNTGPSCSGSSTEGAGNLSDDAACPGGAGDVRLGPLTANGGPTPTMALRPGSAGIDAGPCDASGDLPSDALAFDQRGAPRDASCDTGAFEFVDADGDGRDDGVTAEDALAGDAGTSTG